MGHMMSVRLTDEKMRAVCSKYRPDIVNFAEARAVEKAVLKELVEWLERHKLSSFATYGGYMAITREDWQALRSWL